ncbi:MAG: uroporphyrinogen-III synthase [Rhodospirillaceae bacterium]|nr:uroporphyrinogen-III synthase [Rhodospirillaceae bacterium]
MTRPVIILNTRPVIYRDVMRAGLAPLAVPVIDAPLLETRPLAVIVPRAAAFDALIFTSQIAAAFFPADEAWRATPVYAVGDATADAARRAGFSRVISAAGNARDLARVLEQNRFRRALYPSAVDVAAALDADFSCRIVRLATYRMELRGSFEPGIIQTLRAAARIVVPVFSRRSARAAATALTNAKVTAEVVAIGISATALDLDAPPPWRWHLIAREPTLAAVVDAIHPLVANPSRAIEAA